MPSSFRESIDTVSFRNSQENNNEKAKDITGLEDHKSGTSRAKDVEVPADYPLIVKEIDQGKGSKV